MLPGITYDVVLELAACHGQPLEIREIQEDELRTADEVWMTSSTKEVLAITTLDGRPVGNGAIAGKPGPLGERMWQWYQDFKQSVEMRASSGGNYLSLTCTVVATSKPQLDALYMDLTAHPLVKVVL